MGKSKSVRRGAVLARAAETNASSIVGRPYDTLFERLLGRKDELAPFLCRFLLLSHCDTPRPLYPIEGGGRAGLRAMDAPYKPPNILRLVGVSLKDYEHMENMFDTRLRGRDEGDAPADEPAEDATTWDKLPAVFTGLDDWPMTTNLRCWDMHGQFDNRPVFIPTYFGKNEADQLEIGVKGVFATFNNAARYIQINYHDLEARNKAQRDLCVLYKIFTGKQTRHIMPAPSWEEKQQYGGPLDEDAYWKKLRELDPVHGLKNHTPGTVVPERERALPSVWSLCEDAPTVDGTDEREFTVDDVYA
ncbi:MAG: hypothetical protein KGL39_10890 [Patescibacteria group bacterium]|nr:hypothetical protein [Patescibacteria group bacterium]